MKPVRVVAALDSFKGSLTSLQAGQAVARGFTDLDTGWEASAHAVADGGEGTLEALRETGEVHHVAARDAFGKRIRVPILFNAATGQAVVETAAIVGLPSVGAVDEGVFPRASTYGVGEAMLAARDLGATRIQVALGGSATVDGGTGMLLALGAELSGEGGEPVIWRPGRNPLLDQPRHAGLPQWEGNLAALSDVENPLTGTEGAAAVFGPQKGLSPSQVEQADALLSRWAAALDSAVSGSSVRPGAGAAGGLGAALMALGAKTVSGFTAVAEQTGLERAISKADLVVTGEGKFDAQTLSGKGPQGVAQMAAQYGVPVVVLAGAVDREFTSGFAGVFSIQDRPRPLSEAMSPQLAASQLEATAAQLRRLLTAWGPPAGR